MIAYDVLRNRSAQSGVTLVELMISLVLGLLITAAIYQVFLSNQQSYRMQSSLAHIQESGRFALDMLARDIRHAGYRSGCTSGQSNGNLDYPASSFESGIGDWQDDPGVPSLTSHVADTDVLLVSQAARVTDITIEKVAGSSVHYSASGSLDIEKGNIVIISDGSVCDAFEVKNINNNVIIADIKGGNATWSGSYVNGGKLIALEKTLYFIGLDVDNRPALRRLSLTDNTGVETLVGGVEDMQIIYGVGTNRVDRYVDNPGDWGKVVAVRISLRLSGEERNILYDPAILQVGNIDFQAQEGDLRMHQVFTTTIALRNRLP